METIDVWADYDKHIEPHSDANAPFSILLCNV